jgi:uroporphyrin-III C-methyltransferase
MKGTVYLVGAGPGAPDLLTLRAARLLGQADIVFFDALVHPGILALAMGAQQVAVGKRCGRHSAAQEFINKRLVDAARKHAVVVRLKGGDPMLFGRAQEELSALAAAGVPCEVVPGVTSALAASADLGVSLTLRGVARCVSFATPRIGQGEDPGNWVRSAVAADTTVIYMGAGEAAAISEALIAAGKPATTPVVIVENASLPESHRMAGTLGTLPSIAAHAPSGPALILVGDVYKGIASGAAASRSPARSVA